MDDSVDLCCALHCFFMYSLLASPISPKGVMSGGVLEQLIEHVQECMRHCSVEVFNFGDRDAVKTLSGE